MLPWGLYCSTCSLQRCCRTPPLLHHLRRSLSKCQKPLTCSLVVQQVVEDALEDLDELPMGEQCCHTLFPDCTWVQSRALPVRRSINWDNFWDSGNSLRLAKYCKENIVKRSVYIVKDYLNTCLASACVVVWQHRAEPLQWQIERGIPLLIPRWYGVVAHDTDSQYCKCICLIT